MKKKLLPGPPKGIELPLERTTFRVGDLKDGEAGWIYQNVIHYTFDRKGVVGSGVDILFLDEKIPNSQKKTTAPQGYPLAWVRRNGALLDVVVYYYEGQGFKFQKINLSQLEDGGKTAFYLSSYKEYQLPRKGARNFIYTWEEMPLGGGEPTGKVQEEPKTTRKSASSIPSVY